MQQKHREPLASSREIGDGHRALGQHRDRGVVPDPAELVVDRGRDVFHRLEVGAPHEVAGDLALEAHPGFQTDEGEESVDLRP